MLGQQFGQRRAAPKPAKSLPQRLIDVEPSLASRVRDGLRRPARWPLAVGGMVGVGPRKDLPFGQRRETAHVPHAAMPGKKVEQGFATGEAA